MRGPRENEREERLNERPDRKSGRACAAETEGESQCIENMRMERQKTEHE